MVKKTKIQKDNEKITERMKEKIAKRMQAKKAEKAITDAAKETTPAVEKAGSRADLMNQAKARKIKYFRILNRKELEEVLAEGTTQERTNEIIEAAKTRWKSGWGKGYQKDPREGTEQ